MPERRLVTFYLIRHSKAEVDHPDGDGARRLSDKGLARLKTLVAPLTGLGVAPDTHFSSPLVRAQQTAQVLRDAMGWRATVQTSELLLPDSRPADFLAFFDEYLHQHPRVHSVAIYTHNPYVTELASHLLRPETVDREVVFHTPSVLAVRMDVPLVARSGEFRWLLHHTGG